MMNAPHSKKVIFMPTQEVKFLVVEDNPADIRTSLSLLEKVGSRTEVEVLSSIPRALNFLEDVKAGKRPAPRLVILDLDFGQDSGFEFLRAWRSSALGDVPIIVWTVMEESLLKISSMFGVSEVVPKSEGPEALDQAIARVLNGADNSDTGATGR
jgi:CheY-like chemotaxis protein